MKIRRPPRFFLIVLLGALTTISPFSIDMYLPAFEQIARDFGTTPARVALSLSSYFIGLAFGQLLYGPLLDRFGRKRPLYFGLSAYVLASIGCMQSTSVEMLMSFRLLQAMGGCVALVAARAMVRDFFPVEESVRIFSYLVLMIGLSPLLAPTVGGFVTAHLGWQWIFIILSLIAIIILLVCAFFLPEGREPDPSISLGFKPVIRTFIDVIREPQFRVYTLSGAFAFAALFVYVAGSPLIFLEIFHVNPQHYGMIFALLSVGFIGASQLNIPVSRHYRSARIFRFALTGQVLTAVIFLVGSWLHWFGLTGTIVMFFLTLFFVGMMNPNSMALALAPFERNLGTASALIGSIQIGIAALVTSLVGLVNAHESLPIITILAGAGIFAYVILIFGVSVHSHRSGFDR